MKDLARCSFEEKNDLYHVEIPRLMLELSYNGTLYHGWQIQPEKPTVQGALETVLSRLNSDIPVAVVGCGRTDTGVHARQYFAHVDGFTGDTNQLVYKLNKMLPNDIVVHATARSSLHARFDAKRRTYRYYIRKTKDAFDYPFRWIMERPLNVELMNLACTFLLGKHDFASFAKHDSDVASTLCEIVEIGWEEDANEFIFTVSANRFLRNMVRALVGTLVDVGLEKIAPEEVRLILEKRDRCEASESVPAQGLFLWQVTY